MGARLYISIFSALIAVAIFTGGKFYFSHRFSNTDTDLQGLAKSEKIDWLLIGSSHIHSGYDVDILKAETGLNFYPLWTTALDPYELHVYLEEVLKRHGHKICNIIIDIPTSQLHRYTGFPRTSELFYKADPSIKEKLLKNYAAYPRAYSGIAELLLSGGNSTFLMRSLLKNLYQEPSQSDLFDLEMTAQQWEELKKSELVSPILNPLFASGLASTARLLQERYPGKSWFIQTAVPDFMNSNRYYMQLRKKVEGVLSSNGSVPFLDFSNFNFPTEDHLYFADIHHLSRKGRKLNTKILLENVVMPEMNSAKNNMTSRVCN